MAIRRHNVPRDLVAAARRIPNNSPDECTDIVRIGCHPKLNASAVGLAECDLTQGGNDLFAEDESNGLGRLREMAVRRR